MLMADTLSKLCEHVRSCVEKFIALFKPDFIEQFPQNGSLHCYAVRTVKWFRSEGVMDKCRTTSDAENSAKLYASKLQKKIA